MAEHKSPSDDLGRALNWIDRRQIYGVAAALLGYAAWLGYMARLTYLVRTNDSLPGGVKELLDVAVVFTVLSAFATQFMICNYLTVMARRILQAIHLVSEDVRRARVKDTVE